MRRCAVVYCAVIYYAVILAVSSAAASHLLRHRTAA
jgi:hypothetical protein